MTADAFAAEVCSHRRGLYCFAWMRCRDRMQAEDLAHDTIVKALQARDSFDGRNMSAWLLRILCNHHYSLKRRARFETTEPPPVEPVYAFTGDVACDVDAVLDEVAALPKHYRDALLSLVANDGEYGAYNDVARELGVTLSSVRHYIFRGRAVMRAKFATSEAA